MKSILRNGRFQTIFARFPRWCVFIGLFIFICGAKLWLINGFGNATPFGDEWPGEGAFIKASIEGSLSPLQYFEPHNEHRIAFTRFLVMALLRVDKQWDPILQMVAQAPIHALAIVALVSITGTFMNGLGKACRATFAAGVGLLPFGWENTLWGFQSQFYFMMLFGIMVVWLCWRHGFDPRWWLGALLAFASLFTMAGAVFSIIAGALVPVVRIILERGREWKRRVTGVTSSRNRRFWYRDHSTFARYRPVGGAQLERLFTGSDWNTGVAVRIALGLYHHPDALHITRGCIALPADSIY